MSLVLLLVTMFFFTFFILFVVKPPVKKYVALNNVARTEAEEYVFYDPLMMDQYQQPILGLQDRDSEGRIVYGYSATTTAPGTFTPVSLEDATLAEHYRKLKLLY